MTIVDYGKYLVKNSKVDPKTFCWNWSKYKDSFGYGMATRKDTGYSGLAHRESFKYFKGEIPTGLQVLHQCDNPSCINPDHLLLGTQKENMEDMKKKNRGPDRSGENGPTTKLTTEQVHYIRMFVPEKRGDLAKLAKTLKVSKSTISDIRKGKTWK